MTMKPTKYKYKDQAIGYLVVVEQEELNDATESGIQLYATDEQKSYEQTSHGIGVVKSIGESAFKHPRYGYNPNKTDEWEPPIKVGDLVRFKAYDSSTFREERDSLLRESGAHLCYVADQNILGVLEREEIEDEPKQEQISEGGIVLATEA